MMSGDFLFEMSNFNSRTTGLDGLTVWCRTDFENHGHNRYRIKISKNNQWAAIFTVGENPIMVKTIGDGLSNIEIRTVTEWTRAYSSLIIGLIDGKIDSAEFAYEIQKIRNSEDEE